jgi:hypothetical protein
MKKYIRNIFLLTGSFIVFYVVGIILFGELTPSLFTQNLNYRIGTYGHSFTRLKEVKDVKDVDILFLGSSHAYRGFDPGIYKRNGLKVFNLGTSSQTPIQTHLLLNRYLKNLNPKLIIYDVYPETFSSDGVESAVDIIANDKNDINSLKMALDINHIKVYNTLIYGFYRDLFDLNENYDEPECKRGGCYVSGGFVQEKLSFYSKKELKKKKIEIDQKQLKAFENIRKELDKKRIPLILVYSPITSNDYQRYTNNNSFDSLMKSYSTYYNFNKILNLNDSIYFYDSNHLNQLGVNIYNKEILSRIEHIKD